MAAKSIDYYKKYFDMGIKHIIIKFVLLKKIGERRMYAYSLLKDLEREPHIMFFCKDKKMLKNDVYNALGSLAKEHYIRIMSISGKSKARKYYALTAKGRLSLNGIKKDFSYAFSHMKSLLNQ